MSISSVSAPAKKVPASPGAVGAPIDVLVIGDWVVDENWVLARHRPSLSTMEGKAHLRALGNVDSRVTTFCGAGRVARFLYWMNRYRQRTEHDTTTDWIPIDQRQGRTFSITGLGAWSLQDEAKFFRMFDPSYGDGINPFTLTRVNPHPVSYQRLDGLTLCNLAPAYEAAAQGTQWRDVGTTRVYRLYSHQAESPGGIVLDRRVDFELRFAHDPASDDPGRHYEEKSLLQALESLEGVAPPQRSAARAWKTHTLRYLDGLDLRLKAEAGLTPEKVEAFLAAARAQIKEFADEFPQEPEGGEGRTSPYRFVVVKDLGKGTVTTSLIRALQEKKLIDESTRWFISSKQVHPLYLDTLRNSSAYGRVRLLFLPPMAIAQMTHEGFLGHRWFAGDQEPTYEALEKLDEYWLRFSRRDRPADAPPILVVAMPKGLSIVGVEGLDHERLIGYYQPNTVLNEIDEELSGRASMFFAALSAQLIESDRSGHLSSKALEAEANRRCEMIETALKASHDLLRGNIQALKGFGNVPSNATSGEDLFSYDPSFERYRPASASGRVSPIDQQVDCFQWSRARQLWSSSRQAAGIIRIQENQPRFSLDLWRAMGELDGYIETVKKRREAVAKLISTLGGYLRDVPTLSFSTMLIARPGTGKSFLVSRLSDALGVPFHCFNITQMTSREHVNSCFAAIASAQAQDRERVHLVFFDEINSKVDNSKVFDLFLTVLEDGTYLHGEKRFKLDPCIWIFAGTQPLRDDAFETKEADFKSRMSINDIRLDDFGDATEEQRCLIYQGALQLQLQHTDVKKISAEVLRSFACLDFQKINSRKIRQLAGRFRNIQFGEVRAFNLPLELKKALEDYGMAREAEFIHLLPSDRQLGSTEEKSRDLDNLLVEVRRRPEKADYDDFRRSVAKAP